VSELKKDGHEAAARMVRGFMLQIELRKIMTGGKKDVKQPIEDAVKFLEEAPPQISDLTLAFTAGTLAESGEDHELANTTYARLLKIFKSSNDPKLADFTHILEGVVRRLNLVGQPMKLEGKFLDGESLDWTKYSGKVVLVLFWATDYVPCLRDVPIWKSLYEQYHAKDFEILGISLDRNNTELEDFVKAQSIPWPNVISNGKTNSNMIYYGVTNLPTTMLVGKNGKVLAVDLKSEELKKELEKLLGPVEPSKEKSGK
jgi:thiol-disulfide isomerase/thioredoxin